MPSSGRTFTLQSGQKIPMIGLGTWQSKPSEVERAVEAALRCGYRHIDAAAVYGNEEEVGRGIKASDVPRSEIFVTSKLWNTSHSPKDVEPALNQTLKDLQLDYVDLYLMHWPVAFQYEKGNNFPTEEDGSGLIAVRNVAITETWKAMEECVKKGKAKNIGVSNFTREKCEEIMKIASVPIACNQIEAHPFLQQPDLLKWSQENRILVTAYSPLGNNIYNIPRVVDDPVVVEVAKRLGKQPAQVLISWSVQRGTAVLPKSVTPERIEANLQDFELSQEDFDKISKLEKHLRMNYPVRWGVDVFGEKSEEIVKQAALDWAAAEKKKHEK